MDELVLQTLWKSTEKSFSMVLSNLQIEGGLFDGYNLSLLLNSNESTNPAPNCILSWVQKVSIYTICPSNE